MAVLSLRREAAGVRGREWDPYLDGSLEVPGSQGTKSLRESTQEQGQEPYADRLDESPWDRRVDVF
jgi:hypothetical protein